MKTPPRSRILLWSLLCLLLLLCGFGIEWQQSRAPVGNRVERIESTVMAEQPLSKLPPWSEVRPANHGTNPIPGGFVQTAIYEDVTRLAFPTPAPVAAGLRARVLLGEISGATGRHKYVRIEEVANIKENRLVERRVMPADHLVVFAQRGKTEAEVRAGLPPGFVIRKKLYSGTGVSPVSPEPSRRYLIGFESKNADSLEQATEALKKLPILTSAVPDGYVFSSSIPNDPLFNQQWGLHNTGQTVTGVAGTADADIDAPEAWDLTTGSSAVRIAVIDSGIDLTHEDLVENVWKNPGESGGGKESNGIDDDGNGFIDDVNGWDFVNDDNIPQDDFGHGTHVAGIIGAKGNNGVGIAGVCWNVKLVSLKALRSNGSGLWSDVTDAIAYANAKKINAKGDVLSWGAPVANLSLGAYGSAPLGVQLAFENAADVLFCCAAGNGSLSESGSRMGDDIDQIVFTPAAFSLANVMSVVAVQNDGSLAPFSNFGHVSADAGAPGMSILSTRNGGGYEMKSGTSMAAAFVSASAALLVVRNDMTPTKLRHYLQMTVTRNPRLIGRSSTEGRLNLENVAVAATRYLNWSHLASSGEFPNTNFRGHVLPNGKISAWTFDQVPTPSPEVVYAENVLTIFDNSFFILTEDRQLMIHPQAGDGPSFPLCWSEVIAAGLPNHAYRPVINGGQVIAFASQSGLFGNNYFSSLYDPEFSYTFLKQDGTVLTFGGEASWTGRGAPPVSGNHVPEVLSGLQNIVQVASDALGRSTFALRADGALFGWGKNEQGALGFGHQQPVPYPTQVQGLPAIKRLWMGGESNSYVICMSINGQVWAWGNDLRRSQFLPWLPNEVDFKIPCRMTMWETCIDFSPDIGQGLRSDGKIVVLNNELSAVPGLSDFKEAPLTGWKAIDRFGKAWTWRSFPYAAFAAQPATTSSAVAEVGGNWETGFTGLLIDGRAEAWGNGAASLGTGLSNIFRVPVEVTEFDGVVNIYDAVMVLGQHEDGVLTKLGEFNQAAADDRGAATFPGVIGEKDFGLISLSLIALDQNGNLWKKSNVENSFVLWDDHQNISEIESAVGSCLVKLGTDGELGVVNTDESSTWASIFANIPRPTNFGAAKHIKSKISSSLAMDLTVEMTDGSFWHGPMSDPSEDGGHWLPELWMADPVQGVVDFVHPYALFSDGSVRLVTNGQSTPVEGLPADGFIKLASSSETFAGLRSDGTVWTWGSGPAYGRGQDNGVTLPPGKVATLSDGIDIWGNRLAFYVKRVNGSVWGWGINFYGHLGGINFLKNSIPTLAYDISTEVQNSGLGINDWLTTHFSNEELGSINISGDEADPDRDGLTNLVEYALGSDPKVPSDGEGEEPGLTCSFETVSSEALSADGSGEAAQGELHFTVKLKRRAKRPGIDYRVEFSDDMVNWTSSPNRLLKVLESEKTVIFRDVEPLAVTARRWARLVITKGN